MNRRRHSWTLVLLLLLVGAGVVVILWFSIGGTGSQRGDRGVAPPPSSAGQAIAPPTRPADEMILPPRVPVLGTDTATTVLWPLRIELDLGRAAYLPTDRGVPPIGSGATARLNGRIADESSGGARAEIAFVAGPNEGRVLHTDVTGAFGASDLYPGLSIVAVRGDGLIGSRREVRLRQGTEALLNIGYGRPGAVFGRVLDREGKGIDGARVTFDGTLLFTDSAGDFHLATVASGQVLVEIEKAGYASYQELAFVTAGQVTQKDRLTFTLQNSAALTIHIPHDVGGPGPAIVFLLPGRADRRPTINTAHRNGRFPWYKLNPIEVWPGTSKTINDLPAEVLKVYAFRPGAMVPQKVVNLRPGKPYQVELSLRPAPRIVGYVKQGGKPVAGAQVRLEAPNRPRAALSFFNEPSWFFETEVMPFIPPALQETETDGNGRFVLTSWEDLTAVRYIEARSLETRAWAGRLVRAGEVEIELDLEEVDLTDAELLIDLPNRWQGLPIELLIDGTPYDPFVLPPRQPLRIEDLRPGIWRLRATWHGTPIDTVESLTIDGLTQRRIELIPEAIDGQDEEAWKRAGREFVGAN